MTEASDKRAPSALPQHHFTTTTAAPRRRQKGTPSSRSASLTVADCNLLIPIMACVLLRPVRLYSIGGQFSCFNFGAASFCTALLRSPHRLKYPPGVAPTYSHFTLSLSRNKSPVSLLFNDYKLSWRMKSRLSCVASTQFMT